MPLPTPSEIEAGFEQRNPTPQQSQAINEVRLNLVAAAQFMIERCNDNPHAKRALVLIQQAFSSARSAIVNPATVVTP